jgi:hypothetical protein
VQLHVDQRRGQVLDGGEALVEALGRFHLVDEGLRHGRPGLVVAREAVEDLAGEEPVLVHLTASWLERVAGAG